MTRDDWDELLRQDWSAAWESLEEAPDLVPRAKRTQITVRLPAVLLARVKRVASARGLPYHTLVRSWIIEGLRTRAMPRVEEPDVEAQTEQLNIKLDQMHLDALKIWAHEQRQPYHRLARDLIEWETGQAEQELGLEAVPAPLHAMKDLMVLLLHAPNRRGESAVRGMTRLQKLLFVIEQELASQSRFYAFNYGPFSEEVNDAARALEVAGFTRRSTSPSGPPTFEEMMATVMRRAGPEDEEQVGEIALSERGHDVAEALRRSDPRYGQLYELVESVRREWDTGSLSELVDRVYETWPKYAEKSVIREKVAQRSERRRR